jgi:hypothetical protein
MRIIRSRVSWIGLPAAALVIAGTGVALAAGSGASHNSGPRATTVAARHPKPSPTPVPSPTGTPQPSPTPQPTGEPSPTPSPTRSPVR